MDDRYARIGKVRARYWQAGERGPAVVLIHGLGASLESWLRNIEALSQDHRVFAVDVVWFGKSDKPSDVAPSLEYFAQFVTGFMDHVNLEAATLVGSSLGGMIAVKTTLDFPRRVQSLVLVSPAGFGRDLEWLLRARTLFPPIPFVRPSLRGVSFSVRRLFYDPRTVSDELLQTILEMASEPGAMQAYGRVLKAGVNWRGVKPIALRQIRDSAHAIQVPTMIIWGREDQIVSVRQAEIARRTIPGAKLHILSQCGHAPMLEKPNEFNGLVAGFIRENVAETTKGADASG